MGAYDGFVAQIGVKPKERHVGPCDIPPVFAVVVTETETEVFFKDVSRNPRGCFFAAVERVNFFLSMSAKTKLLNEVA